MLEGDSSTTIPSSGKASASVAWTVEGLRGSDSARGLGGAERLGGARDRTPRTSATRASSVSRDVGDDRVAHRRPRRLVRVVGDLHERGALGEQGARDVGVVGEDRAADDEHQVVARERLAERPDRRRQRAAEVRMALREADPPSARGGGGPHGQALALGQGDRRVPGAAGVDVRARRPSPGSAPRASRSASDADRAGVGDGPAADRALDRVRASPSSDLGRPVVHRDRDEDGPARGQRRECGWRAPSASGTSSARGGS